MGRERGGGKEVRGRVRETERVEKERRVMLAGCKFLTIAAYLISLVCLCIHV